MSQNLMLALFSALALGAVLFGVGQLMSSFGMHLSLHGWIAYGLGAALSFGLAFGLFFLTFKSAREGYDDLPPPDEYGE
ncbi:MAG: hypothetical protein QNI84_03640 [Henriciella sp.]|nr:hypothetical protein [Henriciella sp.]